MPKRHESSKRAGSPESPGIKKPSLTEVIIPISTFVLGCLFTWVLQAHDAKEKQTQTAIHEACRLTKEWYTQIQTIRVQMLSGDLTPATGPAVYDYVHNRLILPDLMLQIEILRKSPKCRPLVSQLEHFLTIVTDFDPNTLGKPVNCSDIVAKLARGPSVSGSNTLSELLRTARAPGDIQTLAKDNPLRALKPPDAGSEAAILLESLDRSLQSITTEAAKLL